VNDERETAHVIWGKHITAGRCVEKQNDTTGGRSLHPLCWYRSQAAKGRVGGRIRSIVAEDNSSPLVRHALRQQGKNVKRKT
jgi:hypothetical protein